MPSRNGTPSRLAFYGFPLRRGPQNRPASEGLDGGPKLRLHGSQTPEANGTGFACKRRGEIPRRFSILLRLFQILGLRGLLLKCWLGGLRSPPARAMVESRNRSICTAARERSKPIYRFGTVRSSCDFDLRLLHALMIGADDTRHRRSS